ncbi:hydrogenase maturation protease [uncultured Mycobacterium sp.]|uniref:hydrogenase maturation protease n=1 Tax=uncultured Mycobacterium sp. TaxID=171292 RepID=UPI0035CC7667
MNTVVIGVGNEYRRDDGIGPAVAAAIGELALPDVRVLIGIEDPMRLLDTWSGAALAVVIDAAITTASMPGRIRRITADALASTTTISTHNFDVAEAFALGQALGRVPHQLVLFAVEVADTSHGIGLTPQVSAAVPAVVTAAVAEIAGVTEQTGG